MRQFAVREPVAHDRQNGVQRIQQLLQPEDAFFCLTEDLRILAIFQPEDV